MGRAPSWQVYQVGCWHLQNRALSCSESFFSEKIKRGGGNPLRGSNCVKGPISTKAQLQTSSSQSHTMGKVHQDVPRRWGRSKSNRVGAAGGEGNPLPHPSSCLRPSGSGRLRWQLSGARAWTCACFSFRCNILIYRRRAKK